MIQWLKGIDRQWLLWLNGHHNAFWDKIMWFASGDTSWFPLYAFLFFVLIYHYKKQSWWLIVLIIPLIICSDQIASGILKPMVRRLRPSHQPGLAQLLHYVNNYQGGTYGFVSSHACNVFAFATYLALVTKRKMNWLPYLLFPWAILVAYSRIYLGVHYPSDVFVPIVIGVALGLLFAWIYYRFKPKLLTSKT